MAYQANSLVYRPDPKKPVTPQNLPYTGGTPQMTQLTQAQPQDVWTREWLRKKGYKDNEIGFDVPSQTVLVRDQPFAKVTQNVDGKSYASLSDLEGAYNRLNPLTQGPGNRQDRYRNAADSTLSDALGKINQPFSFNPETDPRYQAAVKLAEQNAQKASKAAAEQYNSLGILNSTVTGDRLGQIQQGAMSDISARLVPELYNSALAERNQNFQNLSALANMLQGVSNSDRAYDRSVLESDRNFGIQEGTLTGNYAPQNVKDLVSTIIQAKQNNPYGGNAQAGQQANDARAALEQLGYDANGLFGANVDLATAIKNYNSLGKPTLAQKQFNENTRQFDVSTEQQAKQFADRLGFDWASLSQRDKEYLGNLAISQQNANTSAGNLQLNRDEFDLRKSAESQKNTNAEATNRAISEAMKYSTYEEAVAELKKYSSQMAENGVDMNKVLDALGSRFGRVPTQNPNIPLE